jgi:hypothetical protein
MQSAIICFWHRRDLLQVLVPLTDAAALRSDSSWELVAWLSTFPKAIEHHAADGRDLLYVIKRAVIPRVVA